ncbi:MAG: hypothetical protein K0U86_05495 [Planctomycetes bacterium]|nr:hypothetical protein [Planctomycetota bacterium]MCH9724343.1 hypothetical protein [Planctomycetota bacterium]MCH9777362.1 hypothetical protein [Planctomycetota bacterium]MDF1742158.1 hypothetical protein [Gimesia sp.]
MNVSRNKKTDQQSLPAVDKHIIREILGYLNFSNGKPDSKFRFNWNQLFFELDQPPTVEMLYSLLNSHLQALKGTSGAFQEIKQAESVLRIAFEECLPQYKQHHRDLLFHVPEKEFLQPYFLAVLFEALLEQGGPWEQNERIVSASIDKLNDFVGFRPVAVLENGRQMQVYPHEKFRPIPLYLRDCGVASGPYQRLIEQAINTLEATPSDLLYQAHFTLDKVDEIAIDLRAHDHLHPVNKRTNYMFGEWDPHVIDNQGYYRRFVIRKLILDSLLAWIDEHKEIPLQERLQDAAAVLSGTMLMASSISGSGPDTHSGDTSLTSLLPKVARQRDDYYNRLLSSATGKRAERLAKEAQQSQQPFGHIRHYLNLHLARYGAQQVQHRQLSRIYARMGFSSAARCEAAVIPCTSVRFECELQWRITMVHLHLERYELDQAWQLISEIEEQLTRGIECGALIDPWNILGFQGLFPLFISREDSIPDQRSEVLLDLMEEIFSAYSATLSEAAAQGNNKLKLEISDRFQKLAEKWDRYATTTVEDLPHVNGQDSFESAAHVSQILTEWKNGGESVGDISFWRQHVDRFESAKAYALTVDALLQKRDHVAAIGLIMQWLSQVDQTGLESGPYSIHAVLLQWMRQLTSNVEFESIKENSDSIRKMFDYLEANAADYWTVPHFDAILPVPDNEIEDPFEIDPEEPDEEDALFGAAYEDVIFRDSADDGVQGETMDSGYSSSNTEIESINRQLEPRLKFLNTLSQLWQLSAAFFSEVETTRFQHEMESPTKEKSTEFDLETRQSIEGWIQHAEHLQQELVVLLNSIWKYQLSKPSGDHDSNIEYDLQLQTKYYLMHAIIITTVNCRSARLMLLSTIPHSESESELSENERLLVSIYRGVLTRDIELVRKEFPIFLNSIVETPLLYTPIDQGGKPNIVLKVRSLQMILRFLLSQLPSLGMLRETWQLLKTAYRMERSSRPEGIAVSEFDRLFRTGLRSSLSAIIRSSHSWETEQLDDEVLIEISGKIVDKYREQWLKHSRTMRLSSAEALNQEFIWMEVKQFIDLYGADLFHAQYLTLGNLRAILHNGVEQYLNYLIESQDPARPMALLTDLEEGSIDMDEAVTNLKVIFESVVDKFDRFVEYNSTTTQSDYGEMFYCLLDFLRLEAAYERDDWKMVPLLIAHKVLAQQDRNESALIWEAVFEANSEEMSKKHLNKLHQTESEYKINLPLISDHLNERFVKPLAVNRMMALVPRAMKDARNGNEDSAAFSILQEEIERYLDSTIGSGIDVPDWMRSLEDEIDRLDEKVTSDHYDIETEIKLSPVPMSLSDIKKQLKLWNQPLARNRKKKKD